MIRRAASIFGIDYLYGTDSQDTQACGTGRGYDNGWNAENMLEQIAEQSNMNEELGRIGLLFHELLVAS